MEFARIVGGRVIALDINDGRLEFCKNVIQVEETINASKEDVVKRLEEITNADMPTVVIDATGNQRAINNGLQYLGHGGKYVLIGLQRDEISFSHPEFHKRESTLMSSRNATREDFEYVINCMKRGFINPLNYITHRARFNEIKDVFEDWLNPSNGVIKAMVENE
jgi:threonine dehydrogenase-like Zn-dependent dehydrogenase